MENSVPRHHNNMKLFLSIVIFTLSACSFSQDSICVELNVKNRKEGESIQNVRLTITFGENEVSKATNPNGKAIFYLPKGISAKIKFDHHAFISEDESLKIPSTSKRDTLFYTFYMDFIRTQDEPGTIVTAPGIPAVVYHSSKFHVSDFEIDPKGDLILLVYPKQLKKGSELLYYNGTKVKGSFTVPETAEELIRDYRGNPHVVCKENVFGIHASDKEVGISTLPKEYYLTYLAPIVDTNKTKLYFSNFNPDYPAFEYFSYDQLDSGYRKIMHVEDKLMMELYRSEYKWVDVRTKLWAKNKELATGIDAEIWVGANYFTQSIYYKELYAPLFHRNDSLFVFDYYKDMLYTYDRTGEALDSIGIYHHYNPRSSGWKKQLLQDRKTGEVYAVFDRAGYSYLGRVNTTTGIISEQVKLKYRYVDKIQVHGNFVYYIYRPFESAQKRYLYRERLPYEFVEAFVPQGDEAKD